MRKAALRPCESIARTLKPQTQRKTLTCTGERRCIEQTIPPITGDHLHIQLHWGSEPRGWAEVDPMGRTPASGFVMGRGTFSDLSQESSHEGLLLLRLWACGQGGRVVQAKRHVHSPRVENAARPWFGRDVHVHAAITKSDGVYFRCTLNGADGARWQEAPALAHAYEQGCRGLRG